MFDIGFSELVLVFIVGLVVLGPQRMPIAIRTVMKWVRTIRGLAANVQNELSQELKLQELQDSIKKAENLNLQSLSPELAKTVDELKQSAQKMKADLDKQAEQANQSIEQQIQQLRESNFEQSQQSQTEKAEPIASETPVADSEPSQSAVQNAEDFAQSAPTEIAQHEANVEAEVDLDAELAQYMEQYHPQDDIQPSNNKSL